MNVTCRIAAAFCVFASACAGLGSGVHENPIAVLDANGAVSQAFTIDSGGLLTFLNGDAQPHQIFSPECPELDSTVLQPGQIHRAALGTGPKVCHFQDLLKPSAVATGGSVEVRPVPRDPFSDSAP
jgi:hypothetical protein